VRRRAQYGKAFRWAAVNLPVQGVAEPALVDIDSHLGPQRLRAEPALVHFFERGGVAEQLLLGRERIRNGFRGERVLQRVIGQQSRLDGELVAGSGDQQCGNTGTLQRKSFFRILFEDDLPLQGSRRTGQRRRAGGERNEHDLGALSAIAVADGRHELDRSIGFRQRGLRRQRDGQLAEHRRKERRDGGGRDFPAGEGD
jgi:hypothetical protein